MRGKKAKPKAKAESVPAEVRNALFAAAFTASIFAGVWLWVFIVRH
jgi:hypothetical protein